MKKISHFKVTLFQMIFSVTILSGISSCDNKSYSEDTKEIAEQDNEANDNAKKGKDAQFLVNAAEINLEEISLGQLAQNKSMSKNVKALGKMMEDGHTKSLNDLIDLAKAKSIIIPTGSTDKAEDAYKKLSTKTGIDFDKAYCDMMVSGHKNAIGVFTDASTNCNDPDIRAWAVKTLPDLRMHLQHSIMCQAAFAKSK